MVIAEGVTSATHYNTTARQGGWKISLHEKKKPRRSGVSITAGARARVWREACGTGPEKRNSAATGSLAHF